MNQYPSILVIHKIYTLFLSIRWVIILLIVWFFAVTLSQAQPPKNSISPEELMFSFSDNITQHIQLCDTDSYCRFSTAEKARANTDILHSLNCTSTLYLRQNMTTHRCGIIMRYIPGMFQLESGNHSYLTEVQMRVQHRQPGTVDCKVIAYSSNARYQLASRFLNMGRFSFMIYDPKLFIDNILNPLNRRNRKFYRYQYLFALPATRTQPATYCLSVSPRFSNEQLVTGTIYINQQTGATVDFNFSFHQYFSTYHVKAHMGTKGYDMLVPNRMRIASNFKLLGNRINEVTDIVAHHKFSNQNSNISSKNRYDFTRFCQLRLDTTQYITSTSYFDSIRPIPLRDFELKKRNTTTFDINSDSITFNELPQLSLPQLEEWKEKMTNKNIQSNHTQDILLSSHAFNWTNNGRLQLQLPPIFTPSMMQWSGTRGLSLKTRLQLSFFFNDSLNNYRNINIFPSIGYSFKQKQIYWETPISLQFMPQLNGKLTITAGGGNHIYNNEQAEELNRKLSHVEKYDSLLNIINNYSFQDYRDTYVTTDFSLSPKPGLTITIGSNYHRHTLINWNETTKNAQFIHRLTTLGPSILFQWTPAQYFYKDGLRSIPLFSKFPTFMLKYERGFAIGKGETSFERVETDIRYRLSLYALRTLYFRMGGGMFSRRHKQCFLDYDYFRFNYMPQGWNDEFTGEYQLLNPRFYNESSYYLRFTSSYESPMLMLSRLSFLSRTILNERLYLKLLSVRSLPFYTEIGYGINTHLVDFGSFLSISHDHSCRVGCKVVFRLFEN